MPKRRPVLYENLRSKNRENYEVTLTQKGETLLKPQAEASAQPKKDGESLHATYPPTQMLKWVITLRHRHRSVLRYKCFKWHIVLFLF